MVNYVTALHSANNFYNISLRITMTRKDLSKLKFANLLPALACFGIFDIHEGRMQISGKGITIIQNQRYTIITVAGCVEKLPSQPQAGEELTTVFQLYGNIVILLDFDIGQRLLFKKAGERADIWCLAFGQNEFDPLVFQLLDQPGMIRVEVCNQEISELIERDVFTLKDPVKLWKGARPSAVDKKSSVLDVDGVIICRGVAHIDDVQVKLSWINTLPVTVARQLRGSV